MRRLDEVKAQLQQLTSWQGAVGDAQATLELYDLEPDDDMLAEAQGGLDQLRRGAGSLGAGTTAQRRL